jgi:hypothetical protein
VREGSEGSEAATVIDARLEGSSSHSAEFGRLLGFPLATRQTRSRGSVRAERPEHELAA